MVRPRQRRLRGGPPSRPGAAAGRAARLQALVQAGVLGGRGEVGDGVGVGAPLGDRGLARVVGRVVVQVGQVADEAVRVAHAGHAHLLARHELQRAVRAKVQHRVRLRGRRARPPQPLGVFVIPIRSNVPGVGCSEVPRLRQRRCTLGALASEQAQAEPPAARLEDALQECVVGGKAVVRRRGAAEQQAHGVALVAERGLHADEHVAKLLAEDEQVRAVGVQLACAPRPALLSARPAPARQVHAAPRHEAR